MLEQRPHVREGVGGAERDRDQPAAAAAGRGDQAASGPVGEAGLAPDRPPVGAEQLVRGDKSTKRQRSTWDPGGPGGDQRAEVGPAHGHLPEAGQVAGAGLVPGTVKAVGGHVVGRAEPEGGGLPVHPPDERRLAAVDGLGQRHPGVVGALQQQAEEELAHGQALALPQPQRLLADLGRPGADGHQLLLVEPLQGQEGGHHLGGGRHRPGRTGVPLEQHLPGGLVGQDHRLGQHPGRRHRPLPRDRAPPARSHRGRRRRAAGTTAWDEAREVAGPPAATRLEASRPRATTRTTRDRPAGPGPDPREVICRFIDMLLGR